jgi:hypothetical protein
MSGNVYLIAAGVPEPGTWGLFALGLAVVGIAVRRQQRPRRA